MYWIIQQQIGLNNHVMMFILLKGYVDMDLITKVFRFNLNIILLNPIKKYLLPMLFHIHTQIYKILSRKLKQNLII